jgi:hypothetical protein
MAMGRPEGSLAAAARALSMTDWWYEYSPCEKFMRTAVGQRVKSEVSSGAACNAPMFSPHSMSLTRVSTLLVLGPMVPMMEVCESVSVSWLDGAPPRTHLAEELLVLGKVVETGLEACEPGELRRHCVLQDQSLGGDVVMQGGMVVAATDTMVVVVDVAVGVCVLRWEWRDGVAKRRGHWCGAYGGARDGAGS